MTGYQSCFKMSAGRVIEIVKVDVDKFIFTS